MSIYINKFCVDYFRGVAHLEVDNTNHINIIAGDNNSGKTSVLEALLLLRNPIDITNALRVARIREIPFYTGGTSTYENFINLFPKEADEPMISINAIFEGALVSFQLTGDQKRILLEPDDILKRRPYLHQQRKMPEYSSVSVEADAFIGEILCEYNNHTENIKVDIDAYTSATGREIKKENFTNVVYLSPFNHVLGNVFTRIIRNESLKDICLNALRLFDPEILDLLILKNEENNRPIEYIKHMKLGLMPLSTYGDGIKKVLSIINGIAQASGGILLIDEAETAIHTRYYYNIFRFIVKACKQLKVQAFITTHSSEAIDGFLGTQDYDKQSDHDDIQIITLKKDNTDRKTYSRVLPGRNVYTNREQFGFEVRL